jgi:hypothetical protein
MLLLREESVSADKYRATEGALGLGEKVLQILTETLEKGNDEPFTIS